jgi:hypothetical protein
MENKDRYKNRVKEYEVKYIIKSIIEDLQTKYGDVAEIYYIIKREFLN